MLGVVQQFSSFVPIIIILYMKRKIFSFDKPIQTFAAHTLATYARTREFRLNITLLIPPYIMSNFICTYIFYRYS